MLIRWEVAPFRLCMISERPTVFISQSRRQQPDMIGHYDCGKQVDSYSALPQTVIQDDIACFLG